MNRQWDDHRERLDKKYKSVKDGLVAKLRGAKLRLDTRGADVAWAHYVTSGITPVIT